MNLLQALILELTGRLAQLHYAKDQLAFTMEALENLLVRNDSFKAPDDAAAFCKIALAAALTPPAGTLPLAAAEDAPAPSLAAVEPTPASPSDEGLVAFQASIEKLSDLLKSLEAVVTALTAPK